MASSFLPFIPRFRKWYLPEHFFEQQSAFLVPLRTLLAKLFEMIKVFLQIVHSQGIVLYFFMSFKSIRAFIYSINDYTRLGAKRWWEALFWLHFLCRCSSTVER